MSVEDLAALADVLTAFKQGILQEGASLVPRSYCSPNPVLKFRIASNDESTKFDIYVCPGV